MTPLSARGIVHEVAARVVLDGINLDLEAGSLTVLIGPNGAGKSTLLRIMAGDIRPTRGDVFVRGRPIANFTVAELALIRAVLPQRIRCDFAFSAQEVVELGRHVHSRQARVRPQDHEVVQTALCQTGVTELAHLPFPSLSVGEQALVMMARVLAQQTPVLILDEPTASLDLKYQHRLLRLLCKRVRAGTTVVAVLHDLNLAALYADRIGVMTRGRLSALGRPAEVLDPTLLSTVYQYPVDVFDHPSGEGRLIAASTHPDTDGNL